MFARCHVSSGAAVAERNTPHQDRAKHPHARHAASSAMVHTTPAAQTASIALSRRRHPPRNRSKKRKNLRRTSIATHLTVAPPADAHHHLETILHLSHHSGTAATSSSAERAGPHPTPGAQGLVQLNDVAAGVDPTAGARGHAQPNDETAGPHLTQGPNQPGAAHRCLVHPVEVPEKRPSRWPGSGAPRHHYYFPIHR